jgi:hypothetical protein
MIGLLKEKSEIEKLQKEYKIFSELNFNTDETPPSTTTVYKEELVLEECES